MLVQHVLSLPACIMMCVHIQHLPAACLVLRADYAAAWEAVAKDIIYVPSQQRYTRAASATNSDRIASLQVPACLRSRSACLRCMTVTAALAWTSLRRLLFAHPSACIRVVGPCVSFLQLFVSLPQQPTHQECPPTIN
jgi:hypothetical protein